MSDTTLAVRRTNNEPGGAGDRVGKDAGTPAAGGRWVVGLLSVVGTLLLAFLLSPGLRSDIGGLVALLGNIGTTGVTNWILSFGAFSPLVYFFVMVAQVVASPIPAGPVALAGSLVFGVWEGLALSLAGSVVGSVLVFAAARRWGEPLVVRLVGDGVFRKYVGLLDGGGWWLFAILLFPFMPDDAAVALAGLSALSFPRFLVVMVVGRIPGNTTTALLASEWVTGSAVTWISVGIVLIMVLALGFAYRKRMESWVFRRAGKAPVGLESGPKEEAPR